jgi:lipopolysaccharide export system permease protein
MTIIDRYVTWTFFRIFAICLICLTGLFIVVDVFSNLEEFVQLGRRPWGLLPILGSYYAPRVLELFDRTGAMLALTAAIGTLSWMQRYNESAAIEAGGIPKVRIVRPILCSALILIGLSILNREFAIPGFRESLARNAQSWDGKESQPVSPLQDQENGVWILSGKVTPADSKIEEPEFRLPADCAEFGSRVVAKIAHYVDATGEHPAGFLVAEVSHPVDLDRRPSVIVGEQPLIMTPKDYPWLEEGQLFIATRLSLNDIAFGPRLRRYSSLTQQVSILRNSSAWTSSRQRVEVHGRIVRPAVDFAILLIGVPLVVSRRERNIFVALGICLVVVLGIQVFIIVCHSLGAYRIIESAALSAWLPVATLLPLGYAMQLRLEQ